jgi:hypothetical protein
MRAFCTIYGRLWAVVLWLLMGACAAAAQTNYDLTIRLDFDNRSWTGAERVRWANDGPHAESALYFRLYANAPDGSEPRLEVTGVKDAKGHALPFVTEERGAALRVNLREPAPAGGSVEVELSFKGQAPEIDAEETTLLAHVMQQVGAVINNERETRHPRETNFRGRGVMFLGAAYPLLALREGGSWRRKAENSLNDAARSGPANYQVTVETAPEIKVFTSGALAENDKSDREFGVARYRFAGENLRDFALVAGRELRVLSETAGAVEARAVFAPQHEAAARRVLKIVAAATRIFQNRFGPLPLKQISIIEAPLVAGLGSAKFSGGGAIASAFYVDFDSPTMRVMPPLIREQRGAVEESLEWTVARTVAQQWWGVTVGGDAAREPLLLEALTNWSALLYHEETHGPERAQRAENEQLRGVYKIYRTFGGRDAAAHRPARVFRNQFEYAALVSGKGALWLAAARKTLGDEKFFAVIKEFYLLQSFQTASLETLREALQRAAAPAQVKQLNALTARWLNQRRGDEDIAPPDPRLAEVLDLPAPAPARKGNRLARLGKFFWQQMTRIK